MIRLSGVSDVDTTVTELAKTTAESAFVACCKMTDISNHARSKVGSARERELYRYYQPNSRQEKTARQRSLSVLPDDDTVIANGAISPDTTLTALAQLAAIRLNAQRAMVR